MAKRFLWAVLVAGILAWGFAALNAQEEGECDPGDDCFVVYYPGLCHYLEPYSWWWYYWDCGNQEALVAESVEYTDTSRKRLRVRIDREYLDGRRVILIYDLPRKGR